MHAERFRSATWVAAFVLAACSNEALIDDASEERQFVGVDIAADVGLPAGSVSSKGITVEDLDFDGDLDVVLVHHGHHPESLYRNDGGTFTLTALGSAKDRHFCAAADVNGDGRGDLYCSVGANRGKGRGRNDLFLQQPDGSFRDVANAWGGEDPLGRGRMVAFIDANGDHLPDLFVANWPGRKDDAERSMNRFFLNRAGSALVPGPEFGLDDEVPSTCLEVGDVDADGWDDIVVCAADGIRIYRNTEGTGFVDVARDMGLDRRYYGAALADVDRDGRLDLGLVRLREIVVRLQGASGFEEPLLRLPLEHGLHIAAGEANGDDVPDFFVVQEGCRGDEGNLPDLALLSTPSGEYVQAPFPQAPGGCGGQVAALDHDADGIDAFLVANGELDEAGPVQLLSFVTLDPGESQLQPSYRRLKSNASASGISVRTR